jgi:hypothetical protein
MRFVGWKLVAVAFGMNIVISEMHVWRHSRATSSKLFGGVESLLLMRTDSLPYVHMFLMRCVHDTRCLASPICVCLYVNFSAGDRELVFEARATSPGKYVAPPAKVEEMYNPECFGRSNSLMISVV